MKNYSYPSCGRERITIVNNRVQLRNDLLFIHIEDPQDEENFLQIVDLPALSNDVINETCIPVTETYFGGKKIYIYRIEEEVVLKRWLITEDGEEINPAVVLEMEFVSVFLTYTDHFDI